jgi:hypothetical protein
MQGSGFGAQAFFVMGITRESDASASLGIRAQGAGRFNGGHQHTRNACVCPVRWFPVPQAWGLGDLCKATPQTWSPTVRAAWPGFRQCRVHGKAAGVSTLACSLAVSRVDCRAHGSTAAARRTAVPPPRRAVPPPHLVGELWDSVEGHLRSCGRAASRRVQGTACAARSRPRGIGMKHA